MAMDIEGTSNFMYVQRIRLAGRISTMALSRNTHVEPGIINSTRCDSNHACLTDKTACKVEPFIDRDVLLLRCHDKRACVHKRKYLGWTICTCPVNIASHNHQ